MAKGEHDHLLDSIVRIDGELYKCISIAYEPTVTFEKNGSGYCKTYVIGSRNYKAEVKPVKTIPEVE